MMRLTLRTLLAHLDRTLDAADDAAIVAKLRESEFAQNLVARIQQCVSSDKLAAPSPDSTSPADDPNRIGEYLDSVLLAEQVAEVERFCLESDARLAEVAACHQILSIALARPAEVPPALRNRIYELGEQRTAMAAGSQGVDGVGLTGTVPLMTEPLRSGNLGAGNSGSGNLGAGNSGNLGSGSLAAGATVAASSVPRDSITAAMTAEQASIANAIDLAAAGIPPVGPDDSGVSDAPTRLRQAFPPTPQKPEPAMAGSRRFSAAEASEIFGRPSRVVPWLVSLALVASFLFVLSQVFKSLWDKPNGTEVVMQTDAPEGKTIADTSDETGKDSVSPPDTSTVDEDAPPVPTNETSRNEAAKIGDAIEEEMTEKIVEPDPASISPVPAVESSESKSANANEPAAVEPIQPAMTESASNAEVAEESMDVEGDAMIDNDEPVPPIEEVVNDNGAAPVELKLISDQSLFMTRKPDSTTFVLSKTGEAITSGSDLVCPPLYRDKLNLGGVIELTMIGPATAKVDALPGQPVELTLRTGRYLLSEIEPAVTPEMVKDGAGIEKDPPTPTTDTKPTSSPGLIKLVFGDRNYQLQFNEPASMVALDVIHRRQAGADPEAPESIVRIMELLCVRGDVSCVSEGKSVTLKTGQYISWIPQVEPVPVAIAKVPEWISVPKEQPGAIEASAREGLLSLVRPDESIELSLLEALEFRRAEVGALAAQTLAMIDRPSVYFGSDGIFNNVKQKMYWDRHFNTLIQAMDRGPKSAELIRLAINERDAAEANAIYRMLWLFSNEQLASGSDALLVEALDSGNMVVRVLAAENLRAITGTTLGYRPENETAPRRSPDIKKWETRLRKGDIRWPEPEAVMEEAATETATEATPADAN